jgi:hypothetical protein
VRKSMIVRMLLSLYKTGSQSKVVGGANEVDGRMSTLKATK